MKPEEFFVKTYDKVKGSELIQEQIEDYMEKRRAKILDKLKGKILFEMGNDGEPTWRKIEVLDKRASIQFHFMRTEENTISAAPPPATIPLFKAVSDALTPSITDLHLSRDVSLVVPVTMIVTIFLPESVFDIDKTSIFILVYRISIS